MAAGQHRRGAGSGASAKSAGWNRRAPTPGRHPEHDRQLALEHDAARSDSSPEGEHFDTVRNGAAEAVSVRRIDRVGRCNLVDVAALHHVAQHRAIPAHRPAPQHVEMAPPSLRWRVRKSRCLSPIGEHLHECRRLHLDPRDHGTALQLEVEPCRPSRGSAVDLAGARRSPPASRRRRERSLPERAGCCASGSPRPNATPNAAAPTCI